MKERTKQFLRALIVAMPLLLTTGCSGDRETAWWLASPWEPLSWIWVPADMVDDGSGGGTGAGG